MTFLSALGMLLLRLNVQFPAGTSQAELGTPMPAEAAQLARQAFLTSRANFRLSFPMLFFMAASEHFPFLSGV